ncbi:MAG TPA: Ig-like domain-containing protein, partial [bacterium]|nr:Ig-like domain-containing protein [bacterium]
MSRVLLVLSGFFLTSFANSGQALAAPWVSQTSPANQSIGAARNTSIEIWFANAMDPTTILATNVLVTSSLRGSVAGMVTWTAAENRLL